MSSLELDDPWLSLLLLELFRGGLEANVDGDIFIPHLLHLPGEGTRKKGCCRSVVTEGERARVGGGVGGGGGGGGRGRRKIQTECAIVVQ